MDVTDDADLVALVERVVGEPGRVDVLVNNAGYGSYGAVEDVLIDEARRQFEVNVFALARLTQLVLPHMRASASGASSTSPRSAAGSASRSAPGTTRRSSRSKASATPCGWSWSRSASTSWSSSPAHHDRVGPDRGEQLVETSASGRTRCRPFKRRGPVAADRRAAHRVEPGRRRARRRRSGHGPAPAHPLPGRRVRQAGHRRAQVAAGPALGPHARQVVRRRGATQVGADGERAE